MYTVLETDNFREWLGGLKDLSTRIRLARRLDKSSQSSVIKAAKKLAKLLED